MRKSKVTGETVCRFHFPIECREFPILAKHLGSRYFTLFPARNNPMLNAYKHSINKHYMGGLKILQKELPYLDVRPPGEEERKEIKNLFDRATLVQWHTKTDAMAEILRKMESEVVNIDLECTFFLFPREVLQIGLADIMKLCLERPSMNLYLANAIPSGLAQTVRRAYLLLDSWLAGLFHRLPRSDSVSQCR